MRTVLWLGRRPIPAIAAGCGVIEVTEHGPPADGNSKRLPPGPGRAVGTHPAEFDIERVGPLPHAQSRARPAPAEQASGPAASVQCCETGGQATRSTSPRRSLPGWPKRPPSAPACNHRDQPIGRRLGPRVTTGNGRRWWCRAGRGRQQGTDPAIEHAPGCAGASARRHCARGHRKKNPRSARSVEPAAGRRPGASGSSSNRPTASRPRSTWIGLLGRSRRAGSG